MVQLSKSGLERQAQSRTTVHRTKQLITGTKLCMLVMGIIIVISNFEIYEYIQHHDGAAAGSTVGDNGGAVVVTNTIVHATDEAQHQPIHVVFSTACSLSHDWQSYLFFFHALKHGQQGDVTRIVSGCSPEDELKMHALHTAQFTIMNPNFLIHFTPEFGKQLADEGVSYQKTKYWNKPFGLKHWMEHRFGYVWHDDDDSKITVPEYDEHIIVLVDPDMLMQKPFVNDFSQIPLDQWNRYYRERLDGDHTAPLVGKVTQGHPAAQDYSFGPKWLNPVRDYLEEIVQDPHSPVHTVSQNEAKYVYAAGPPYWMTARDAFRISKKWTEFLPRIFKRHPQFMAEMYGYCMAAAHLGLKHQMARGMMISNINMPEGEGWSFLPKDPHACEVSRYHATVPNVIHFCQRYAIGNYFINKYLFPTDILSCDFPLMELPPMTILQDTWYSHWGDGTIDQWDQQKDDIRRYRNAFMICSLFPAMNAAATFYKDHHCDKDDPTTTYELTYNHFTSVKGMQNEQQQLAKKKKQQLQ